MLCVDRRVGRETRSGVVGAKVVGQTSGTVPACSGVSSFLPSRPPGCALADRWQLSRKDGDDLGVLGRDLHYILWAETTIWNFDPLTPPLPPMAAGFLSLPAAVPAQGQEGALDFRDYDGRTNGLAHGLGALCSDSWAAGPGTAARPCARSCMRTCAGEILIALKSLGASGCAVRFRGRGRASHASGGPGADNARDSIEGIRRLETKAGEGCDEGCSDAGGGSEGGSSIVARPSRPSALAARRTPHLPA